MNLCANQKISKLTAVIDWISYRLLLWIRSVQQNRKLLVLMPAPSQLIYDNESWQLHKKKVSTAIQWALAASIVYLRLNPALSRDGKVEPKKTTWRRGGCKLGVAKVAHSPVLSKTQPDVPFVRRVMWGLCDQNRIDVSVSRRCSERYKTLGWARQNVNCSVSKNQR